MDLLYYYKHRSKKQIVVFLQCNIKTHGTVLFTLSLRTLPVNLIPYHSLSRPITHYHTLSPTITHFRKTESFGKLVLSLSLRRRTGPKSA